MTMHRARSSERGQILVFVAVSLLALCGIAALAIDTAYLYDQRNKLYAAADAAAKSAAFAHWHDSGSDLCEFARHEVTLMGLTPVAPCFSTGGTNVEWYRPPRAPSPYSTNANYVEVIVSQPLTATFFGRVLGWMTANPGARAVAGVANPNNCLTINGDLTMGRTTLNMAGCDVGIGGNLNCTNPTATVTPASTSVGVGGTTSGTCSRMGNVTTGAPPPPDPLAGKLPAVPNPSNPASCTGTGASTVIGPGCYNNIGAGVTTLLAGDYYITGTVNIDRLSGDDVFLYLAAAGECLGCGGPGGRLNVVGQNKTLHVTAHTTGSYQGVVVWQNIANPNPFSCIGCPPAGDPFPPNQFTLEWSGAFYMPGVDQEFRNAMTFTPLDGCGLYIARNLTINNGSGSFDNTNCAALFGNAAFLSIAIAE